MSNNKSLLPVFSPAGDAEVKRHLRYSVKMPGNNGRNDIM